MMRKRLPLAAIICFVLGAVELRASEVKVSEAERARFLPYEIYLDSPLPVAAWQVQVNARNGRMRLVGIEGGDSQQFRPAPYYDRETLLVGETDKVLLADYSLADESLLPSGKFRIATLHLMLLGTADLEAELIIATTRDGSRIEASLEFVCPEPESKEP